MITFRTLEVQGFGVFEQPQRLSLEHRGLALILGDNRDTDAARSNGAGKTTVFKALAWALYQRTIDGLTTDVIHRRARAAAVTVEFDIDARSYRVHRRRTPSRTALELHQRDDALPDGWLDLAQTRHADTQAALEALLGMDWDAFRCCVLFGQGDTARFASPHLGDAARKAVLGAVLGLHRYDQARQRARDQKAQAERELKALDEQRGRLDGGLRALHERAAFLSGQLAARGAQDASHQNDLLASQTALLNLATEREELRDLLAELAGQLALASATLEGAQQHAQAAATEDLDARHAARALQAELDALLDRRPCPTCGQHRPHDPDATSRAQHALDDATARAAASQEATRTARDAQERASASVAQLRERIATSRERLRLLEQRARSEQSRLEQLKRATAQAAAQTDALRDELSLNRDEADALQRDLGALQAQRAEREQERQRADFWIHGFGPKGVPALAIEQALPVLNARANQHLFDLADGDIRIAWTATATATTGATKEELTQHITIEGITDAAPSGGQLRKIELATELALADIVRQSTGRATNLLLLDEVLEGLDPEGIARVHQWLLTLPYDSILLITHAEHAADLVENVITVVKQGGAAEIVDR